MRSHFYSYTILLFCFWLPSTPLSANGLLVSFGPQAVGNGGPNSLNLPPSIIDVSLAYISDSDIEYHLSVTGLGAGIRETFKWGGYVGLGGALAVSINGAGLGIYSLWGYEFYRTSGGWGGHLEYYANSTLGTDGLITPYTIRIGASKWW